MGFVATIHNQKGGTGKSTTSTSLAALLALLGRDVLLIDSDPQANATDALGFRKRREGGGDGYAEFAQTGRKGRTIVKRRIQRSGQVGHIHVMGAHRESLIGLEAQLQHPMLQMDTNKLAEEIAELAEKFDYVLIDTAPGVTHLTVAALKAADVVLAPVVPTHWAQEGVDQVISTIKAVRSSDVPVWPVLVMTTHNKASKNAYEALQKKYGELLFEQTIRRSGSVEGYESKGKTLLQVRSSSPAAKDYIAFAQEFLERMEDA